MEKGTVRVMVASSSLGEDIGTKFAAEIENKLKERGLSTLFFGNASSPEHVREEPECLGCAVLVATGGTEDVIVEAGRKSRSIYLFYHDSYNSLPATLEAVAYLRELGKRVRVYKYSNPEALADFVEMLKKAAEGADRLRKCRLGVVGGISSWLVYSRVSPQTVRERIGAELVEMPLDELLKEMDKKERPSGSYSILSNAREIRVSEGEIEKALLVHEALEEIAKRHQLCGLTVKCFDLIMARKTTACLSMSLMNTRAFPVACEGDVPLLISMALGEFVTGKPAFMGNPASIAGNELLIAHCTSPLISSFMLTTHFESGMGVGISVDFPAGEKATVFRVDPKLETIRIAVGKVKERKWRTDLCRTQVLLEVEDAEKILRESMGNHYALILGDWRDHLSLAGEMLGLRAEFF